MLDGILDHAKKDKHEYVDLGLSVKWATCNVGANAPEEYGDYFAWGEPETYYIEGYSQDNPCSNWKSGKNEGYYWSSYRWCKGSYNTQTKYNIYDYKCVLDAADDAATVNWGGSWRMPDREEQDELRNKCTWNWITKNGVYGYNVVGPNGNSIFLPAAGCCDNHGLSYAGSYGYYWSSQVYTGVTYFSDAYCLYFDSDCHGWGYDFCGRCRGFSVRPVCQ